jgi:hypothetical protein
MNDQISDLNSAYWWIGQIVSSETWEGNENRKKWKNPNEIPGWGHRYKVRIFGRDTENDIEEDQLRMCEVLFPVTAGSGHAAGCQTPNLRQGTMVFGVYRDNPMMCEHPLILGCLGNNDQTQLARSQQIAFSPTSGFDPKTKVPYTAISSGDTAPNAGPAPMEGSGQLVSADNANDEEQKKDGKRVNSLASDCKKIPVTGIQLTIKNLIQDIERVKKDLNSWKTSVTKPILFKGQQMSVSEYLDMKVNNAAKDISKSVKQIVDEIRKYTTEKINNSLKDTYYQVFPNKRPDLKKKVETANDTLSCLFNNIISNLLKMIGQALLSLIDRFINVPICLVENFLGALLGQIMGLINGTLGVIEQLIGFAFDIVGDLFGFIQDLLGLLTCDEEPDCAEINEWSIWDGPGANNAPKQLNVDNVLSKIQEISSTISNAINVDTFNFELDFSNLLSDTCNVGPVTCGPPEIVVYGGNGTGTLANAIISATGDLLGVDIIASGFGFTKQPFISVVDACGYGSGAIVTPVLGPVTILPNGRAIPDPQGTEIGIVDTIVEDPGFGYLRSVIGSVGGDGRVWANECQSIIQKADGRWDSPYDPGSIMQVEIGDTVTLAGQSPYVASQLQIITAPQCPPTPPERAIEPSSSSGEYPVFLTLCDLRIANGGINYSPTDKIVVTPNNGAILDPVFGANGVLEKVNIVAVGAGFTERPEITIQSETGYNAEIIPILCVNRIGDIPEAEAVLPPGARVISVVDCVGKV